MTSKAGTDGNAKADKKKTQKKGAPFSGVAGAFDAANDATMALARWPDGTRGFYRRNWPDAAPAASIPTRRGRRRPIFPRCVSKSVTGKSTLLRPQRQRFMDRLDFTRFFKAARNIISQCKRA